jgi:putative DNA primase/helicase
VTLFYFIPRHTLADEVVQEFEVLSSGLRSAVYRGIDRPDPDQPDHAMCRDLELAKAAMDAGQSLEVACDVCVMSLICAYRKQRDIIADIWVLPNHMAFLHKPDWIPKPSYLIFDEDFLQAGLEGFDKSNPLRVAISTFSAQPGVFPDRRSNDDSDRADLSVYRNQFCTALASGEGSLRREVVEQAGLTADDCHDAMRIEWRYKGRLVFQKNTSREDALSIFSRFENRFVSRVPIVWELMADFLESDFEASPCLTVLRNEKMPKGEGRADYLQLHRRRKITKSYRDKPTLILNATGNADLIEPYFPAVKEVANISAFAPNRHIRQVTNRSFAKSMFVYPPNPSTAANNVKRLHRVLEVEAARHRGKSKDGINVLSVCQMDVEVELEKHTEIAGLDMAHFNAVAGVNKWENVAKQVIVGRTLPPPKEIEHMTAVLTGKPIATISQSANNWWRFPVPIHMQDGTKQYVMAPRHPNSIVEALRWQVCEGQLLQTEGRGRAVNRGSENPLGVDLYTNVPLPLLVDESTTWDGIQPSPIDLMAARGIVGLDWPTVAAVLPDWFNNSKAAEDWFRHHPIERQVFRGLVNPENAYIDTIIGVFGVYALVRFKVEGNRRSRSALVDLSIHPEPETSLASIFGQSVEIVSIKRDEPLPATYLEPPFEVAKPLPPPVNPKPPSLASTTPEPDLTPEPGSYEAEILPCGSVEQIYQHVVAGMDDLAWLDPDAAGLEAARRWLAAIQLPSSPADLNTDYHRAVVATHC